MFFHCSAITDGDSLREGDSVEYELVFEKSGKTRAKNVTGGVSGGKERRQGGGECYNFRDGNCTRGDSCRYSHSGGGDRRGV